MKWMVASLTNVSTLNCPWEQQMQVMNNLKDYLVAFSVMLKLVNGSVTNELLLVEGKWSNIAKE